LTIGVRSPFRFHTAPDTRTCMRSYVPLTDPALYISMSKNTKRVGRRRWAKLTRFLEETMTSGGSERTRMNAAMRLADVLLARETRELAELRAASRIAEKAGTEPDAADNAAAPVSEPESAEDAARRFLESIRAKTEGQDNA